MKLWGGRFSKATDGLVDDFHSSISFDQRLAEQDITGSRKRLSKACAVFWRTSRRAKSTGWWTRRTST